MLEGTEEHILDGENVHMEAGDICFHPSKLPHGGMTKTGFKGIDIFCPPRNEPGGHVERMKKYETMPDENGEYPKNKIAANVKPWFQGVMESLKK